MKKLVLISALFLMNSSLVNADNKETNKHGEHSEDYSYSGDSGDARNAPVSVSVCNNTGEDIIVTIRNGKKYDKTLKPGKDNCELIKTKGVLVDIEKMLNDKHCESQRFVDPELKIEIQSCTS
jgi:hypothetical protein